MARFKGKDLYLKDDDQVYFGDNQEAALWFDNNELRLNHTISGIEATQGYHLITLNNMEEYVDEFSAQLAGTTYFLHNHVDPTASGYEQILKQPGDEAEGYDEVSIAVGDGETLIDQYITVSGEPNTEFIPAGVWTFHIYGYCDSGVVGDSYIRAKIYKRSAAGTEAYCFESTTPELSTGGPFLYTTQTAASGIDMEAADRIVLKLYAETSSSPNRDIRYYYEGSENYTHFITPIVTNFVLEHNSLQALNSGDYKHLTASEYTDLTDGGASTAHKHDHGGQDGLDDDDHTQYILVDGSRGFTSTVSGTDPTQGYHLATRQYLEDLVGPIINLMCPCDLEEFLDLNAVITDPLTTLSGGWVPMSILLHRRELYNDTDNPLYVASVTPILGVSGTMVDAQNRIGTLEYLHADTNSWHMTQISGIDTRVDTLEYLHADPNSWHQTQISGINTKAEDAQDRVLDLEDLHTDTNSWHMTQISGIDTRVDTLEYIHTGPGWHQTQISGIGSQASDAQSRAADLEYIHTAAGWHQTAISGMEYRIWNLEDIHSKDGWHSQEVKKAVYVKPENLLIYYGWLNSFNYTENAWSNEKIAHDMAKYTLIVFGDGIQDSGHGDYANTQVIVPRVKAINPYTKVFGYVTANQAMSAFETKADQWDGLGVDGIFMDECGYDYGTTRSGFNERVDYVHGLTNATLCFANAWEMDHIIGTTNDPSYPNSTYNTVSGESNLTFNDWFLLESHPVNTTSYAGNGGYESKVNWSYRASKAAAHRYAYEINLAAVGIINNNNANGQDLFDFGFISSLMWSLEGFGTSDTSYASGSATVDFWPRPDVSWAGRIWTTSPTIPNDLNDTDIYYRYAEFAKFMLDFSTGAQESSIENYS